jgi:transcriptional regulator with XRE-family HTH domain/sugar lactone lactonase YvrE
VAAGGVFKGRWAVAEQPDLGFAELLRQLRAEARLTQEELAEAAGLSPRAVSDLERGFHRTAHKDTAVLLAGALGLAGPARELFVAAARGRAPARQVLTAVRGAGPGLREAVTASPYRGLAVFEEQDAALFFGREAATVEVLERMSRLGAGASLLVVSGVSGAGKSSLLRAGVLPRIRGAGLAAAPGPASWPCLVFTPTREPLDELALRVAPLAGADAAAVRRGLAADPAGFALTARQAARARPHGQPADSNGSAAERDQPPPQRWVLLVIDQFEEVFTQCPDEAQRRAFITALHAAATARHGPEQAPAALVVLGVRADFEARCADYPQLAGPVQDRYLVTAMTERQLRMAITEPAKKAGSKVDDGLADMLLAEVRTGQPGTFGAGVLPLLSHALDQAWRCRTGDALTLADYERAGGIEGAVAGSAQRAYDQLTPSQQAAARQVFLRLIATSSEGVDTAGRATRAELAEGKSAAEAQDVEAVLEAFAAERLLTLAAGTVEISHEALLTAWPLLRDTWLADTHADRIVRTRLHATAAEWARHSRDLSYLYSGSLLQAATGTAARIGADPARHPPLSQTEYDFLHASDRAHRRTVRRRQGLIALLTALVLGFAAATVVAVHAGQQVAHRLDVVTSRQLNSQSGLIGDANPALSKLLSVAAWRINPSSQARDAMRAAAVRPGISILPVMGVVNSVTFSPGGKTLADGDVYGNVQLWDIATLKETSALPTPDAVNSVAFSPDGTTLATGSTDGSARLWDVATSQQVGGPLTGHAGRVNSVAFSPDGTTLAAGSNDGSARVWDVATHRPPGGPLIHGRGGAVLSVAFSPDGTTLGTGSNDGSVRLWDVATHRRLGGPLTGQSGPVNSVAFSPDGTTLAAGSTDNTVLLWDTATHRPLGAPLTNGQAGGVNSLAFSPDGTTLAAGFGDGTVWLWRVATHQPISGPFTGHTGPVNSVAFSPDGKTLASGSSDQTVRFWNVAAPGQNLTQTTNLAQYLCALAGRSLTRTEWTRWVPGLAYQRVCP